MGAEQLLEIFKVEIGYVTASTDGLTPSYMWWKAGHTAREGANFDLSILCRMDVLGELLVTLNQCWREEDANRIHGILSCLPKTSRFNLAVEFLTRTEKEGVGPSWCLHNFLSLKNFLTTYRIALNFRGSLISQILQIFNCSRKYLNKNFWHVACGVREFAKLFQWNLQKLLSAKI